MKRAAYIAVIVLALLAAISLISCSKPASSAQEDKETLAAKDVQPINIKIAPVTLTSLSEQIVVSGETLADSDVTFSAEIGGRIEYLAVDLGAKVTKGQTLARIDYEMQKAQADQAQAQYDLAMKTFDRLNALKIEELISQQQIDEAETNRTLAEAQLKIAKASLSKSLVKSTINGIVARKFVETGEFVGPGSPVFQIVDFKRVIVKAELPETLAAKVEHNMPVKVRIDALGKEFDGKVHVVLPAANPESKTFQMRAYVDNANYSIKVGMAATVKILAEEHNDVVVAIQDSVLNADNKNVVYVEKDGIAHRKEVVLGATEGQKVIISEGLNVGENLVIVGQRELVDGQPVKVIAD